MKVSMMVAENPVPLDPAQWERLLASLPESLHSHILAYHRWEDRQASLLARLMLAERFGIELLVSIKRDFYGRPGLPGAEFNLSHTDGLVVLAVADERVGVDVERIRPVNLVDYGTALSSVERQRLEASNDQAREFFNLWTAKEAAVKADGRGMSIQFEKVVVEDGVASVEGADWRLTRVSLGNEYACHLAMLGGRVARSAKVTTTPFFPFCVPPAQ